MSDQPAEWGMTQSTVRCEGDRFLIDYALRLDDKDRIQLLLKRAFDAIAREETRIAMMTDFMVHVALSSEKVEQHANWKDAQ